MIIFKTSFAMVVNNPLMCYKQKMHMKLATVKGGGLSGQAGAIRHGKGSFKLT